VVRADAVEDLLDCRGALLATLGDDLVGTELPSELLTVLVA
jgi:hypothetical protein